MCYSVSKSTQTKELLEVYTASIDEYMLLPDPAFLLNSFSHPAMSGIVADTNKRVLTSFRWGLIPSWTKTEGDAAIIRTKTVNAMSETVFEKPSFRSAAVTRRCIIPVNGFFEWMHKGKLKFPHYIYHENQGQLLLAGIHESWINKETGEELKTCSILTTAANTMMSEIHNVKKRMPVVLSEDEIDIYLDPSSKKETISDLCRTRETVPLKAHTISKLITSRTEDPNKAEVLKPYTYPELQAPQTLF